VEAIRLRFFDFSTQSQEVLPLWVINRSERELLAMAMAEPVTPARPGMARSRAKGVKPKARAVA
jgi:hypothetical protein